MKLLFDQNLSHRLVGQLAAEFPDSAHVRDVGLAAADDHAKPQKTGVIPDIGRQVKPAGGLGAKITCAMPV